MHRPGKEGDALGRQKIVLGNRNGSRDGEEGLE